MMSDGFMVTTRETVRRKDGQEVETWSVVSFEASQPSSVALAQFRQAHRGTRVRVFSDTEWDALPEENKRWNWVWHSAPGCHSYALR